MSDRPWQSCWLCTWLTALVMLASGCAHLGEREIVIPAARLNDAVAKRLGIERKLLDILSVKIDRPKLTLDPSSQRLRADFDLVLGHPFSSRPITGRAGISGALGFDASAASVMLLEPKVESLQLDAVPAALNERITRLGAALGADLLSKYPLVPLREKDLQSFGRDYSVVRFEVLEDGVRVMLRAKE
jgi:hypothetical protein